MTWAIAGTGKRASNMTTQAFAKTRAKRKRTLVIRFIRSKNSLTNKPLGKRVLDKINLQFVNTRFFTYFFHGSMVIGSQHKYTTKNRKSKKKINNSKDIFE